MTIETKSMKSYEFTSLNMFIYISLPHYKLNKLTPNNSAMN